ncbi:hypothetical protein V6Z11_D10G193800 [Gossypium hirsutum]
MKRCICFEEGLRDNLRVLIAPHRERIFAILVDKMKIAKEVKRVECENRDRVRGKNKRDSEPSNFAQRPKNGLDLMGLRELKFQLLLLWFSHVGIVVDAIRVNVEGDVGRLSTVSGIAHSVMIRCKL